MSDNQKILFEIYLENNEFKVNAKEAQDGLGKIGDSAKKSEGAFSKLKNSWVGTTLALGAMYMGFKKIIEVFGDTVKSASKLQETTNKFNTVFKENKTQADAFAKTLQNAYGLAKEESMSFLAGTGDILTGLGMQSDKALELSNSVAQLGIDLASFSNVEGGSERAIGALTSALTGEREALKAYGIVVSEEMVKAELVAQGKDKLTGIALNQAKAEATVAIAYAQSGNAIGDMARSFDSYANIQRRVDSQLANMKAEIGQELLPAMSNLGLAFLNASKDGGVLQTALVNITKFIGSVVNGLAILIAKLNQMSASNVTDKMLDDNKKLMESYKANQKAIIDQWGSLENLNKASKEGNTMAMMQSKYLEVQKGYIQGRHKLTMDAIDDEKSANDGLSKILKNVEDAENGITTAIANREKEKKKESTTASSSSTDKNEPKKADANAIYAIIDNETEARTRAKNNELANAQSALDQKLISEEEFQEAKLAIEEKYQKTAMDSFQKDLQAKMGAYQTFTSGIGGLVSGFSEIVSMNASNQTATIDNETQSQMDRIQSKYEAEKLAIENSTASETEKATQLKALDEKREREEKLIQDKASKEKRKIARETAEIQKKISLYTTSVEIPTTAFMAFSSAQALPFPASVIVGGALAASATALGLAKLKMIQEQPLPSYAVGTWAVPNDQIAQIHQGEMIIPKTFADSVRAGEGAITGGSGAVVNNYYFSGSYYDSAGLLEAVDDAQEKRARNMGATKYNTGRVY